MDCELMELMQKYKKARTYFDRTDVTTEEKLKHLDRLEELTKQCGQATAGMGENDIREMME
jgi:L-rhamnose isomerase